MVHNDAITAIVTALSNVSVCAVLRCLRAGTEPISRAPATTLLQALTASPVTPVHGAIAENALELLCVLWYV